MREKVIQEMRSLEAVYKTIVGHNNYLRSQLDTYKSYLQNVRMTSGSGKDKPAGGVGVVSVNGKEKKPAKSHNQGPFKFTHAQMEKEGVIASSSVPQERRAAIFFSIASPQPGSFVISLNYKGRERAILEMDLTLDDILEKQKDGVQLLDLEYVQLDVDHILTLLNKTFTKRKGW